MGSEEKKDKVRIIHVANISLVATKENVHNLFAYIGKIEECKVYPTEITSSTKTKVAFIKYDDERSVEVAQHLTNVVLIDTALVCIPYLQPTIPEEQEFFNTGGLASGQRQLPPHVTNKIETHEDGSSLLLTVDPTLGQLGVPDYPPLPGNSDLAKVEEIRRTIYVGNLPKGISGQVVLDFFNNFVGEVMYVRMATGPDTLPCAYAYVEFSSQTTVPVALQNNGIEFEGRNLRIQHSKVAIIKPQQKTDNQALEEVEEAIRLGKDGREPRRSRSPPRRRRSPSPRRRSPSPRRRSRTPPRRRSRSRDRRRRSRSRSETRRSRRSRSRSARRKRSVERNRKRSRSRDNKKRRSKSRERKRSRDRKKESRKSRSRSRERKIKKERDDTPSDDESLLRAKLMQKVKKRKSDSSDSEWEEAKPEKNGKSKVRNERKRRVDSDSD